MLTAKFEEVEYIYSLKNESSYKFVHDDQLFNKCSHNLSGFQIIEFSYECFVFKLNDFKFVLLTLIFSGLITLDIIANTIVIVSIFMEKNKKRVDICFMSNAIADLMMGTIIMPFTALYTLFGHFPYSHYVCFLWNSLDFTAGTVSMLHIAFISYDRFLSVSKPLKYTQKKSDSFSVTGLPTSLILVFIWFLAAAAWIPAILFIKSSNQEIPTSFLKENHSILIDEMPLDTQNKALSECNIAGPPLLIVPHSLIVYFLPMIIIFVFYYKTIMIVNRKMSRRLSNASSLRFTPGRLYNVHSSPNFENHSLSLAKSDTSQAHSKANNFLDDSSIENLKPTESNSCSDNK